MFNDVATINKFMEKITNILIQIGLFTIAIICFVIVFPISLLYAFLKNLYLYKFKEIFLNSAISIDIIGNTVAEQLFNDIFITKDGYKFGLSWETISSVLGKNQLTKTLTPLGNLLANTLDKIDKQHCFKCQYLSDQT